MAFGPFCASVVEPICSYLDRCGLIDPAADCVGLGASNDYASIYLVTNPCTPDLLSKEVAGAVVFEPAAAAACLGALADAGCDTLSIGAVSTVCASSSLLAPNSPPGSACTDNDDCLAVDAGLNGPGGPSVCAISLSDPACSGYCTVGYLLGQRCNLSLVDTNYNYVACAPGQGSCRPAALADGGSDYLCLPYVVDGGACDDTWTSTGCGGPPAYCADAGLATLICQPVAPVASACDPTACANAPAQCPCGANPCAPTTDPHTGTCQAPGRGNACVTDGYGSCGVSSLYTCLNTPFADAGSGSLCRFQVAGLGSSCDETNNCPRSAENCTLSTSNPVCAIPGAFGDPCSLADDYPCVEPFQCVTNATEGGPTSLCMPPTTVGGSCDVFGGLDCDLFDACGLAGDGGTVCLPQVGLGETCQLAPPSSSAVPCSTGACVPSLADGGARCIATSPGMACDPSVPEPCGELGYCGGVDDDGGSYCLEGVCAD